MVRLKFCFLETYFFDSAYLKTYIYIYFPANKKPFNRLKPCSITQYFILHEHEAGHSKIVYKATLLNNYKIKHGDRVSENEILQCFLKNI